MIMNKMEILKMVKWKINLNKMKILKEAKKSTINLNKMKIMKEMMKKNILSKLEWKKKI